MLGAVALALARRAAPAALTRRSRASFRRAPRERLPPPPIRSSRAASDSTRRSAASGRAESTHATCRAASCRRAIAARPASTSTRSTFRRATTRRASTRSACSCTAASAASKTTRLRVRDRTAGWPAPSRSTSCRTPGETRRGGAARQVENLRAILDLVKRTYNVDENRVVLSGVSDGGTGAYYTAMRETTPFASFLPLNGFIMVLRNETAEADGDLFPNNLLNKPLFIVNGGRDPMYPTSIVDPYVEHLKRGGVDLVYRPQPNAAHDTSWWPDVKDSFEQFVADHPRRPLPDTLSWESGPPNMPSRAHWLVIDRLARRTRPDEPALPDVNRMSTPPVARLRDPRQRHAHQSRASRDPTRSRSACGRRDVVLTINNQPAVAGHRRRRAAAQLSARTAAAADRRARQRIGQADRPLRADRAARRSRGDVSAAARVRPRRSGSDRQQGGGKEQRRGGVHAAAVAGSVRSESPASRWW